MPTEKQHYLIFAVLWLSVTLVFIFLRASTLLVWDDTPRIAANLYDSRNPSIWSGSETITRSLVESFAHISPSGYRPLSQFVNLVGIAYFSSPVSNHFLWFTAVGAVIGLLACCAFAVSRYFLNSDSAALLATFFFVFSTPFITGAWIVFAGIQALVPLIICSGLIVYWKITYEPDRKLLYFLSLFLILFVGPWFREFIGILPLLILFLEFQRHRRPTAMMGIALVFFLHSVFPTALVKAMVFPDLPVSPVFAMGLLGNQMSLDSSTGTVSSISQMLTNIRWDVPMHFLSLYPPVLLLTVLIVLFIPTIRIARRCASSQLKPTDVLKGWRQSEFEGSLFILFLLAVGAVSVFFANRFGDHNPGVLLSLCGAIGLAGLNRNAFLTWWFLLSFLPFLKIFTEQVHLAYSLLPASIVIVAALEDLWRGLQKKGKLFRYSFLIIVLLAVGDHFLNLYGSYRVVRSINEGTLALAQWFKSNVPEESVVITNALHPEDMRLFSGGHITVFWTIEAGIPLPSRAIDDPPKLEAFLRENEGKRSVYFLNVDFNYTPDKAQYHSHKYIWDRTVAVEELGLIHTTRTYYPYLDPVKVFFSRPYISFLGAPDLENDFYRGPARDGTPFLREVYAEYHIYKVVGTSVHPWNSTGPVRLHREGYRGFNILVLNSRFFAIPQSEGAFDLQRIRKKMYSMSFVADEYEKILRQIDHALEQEADASQSAACESSSLRQFKVPTLIEEGYRMYNILGYGSRIYAIPQGEGVFAIERIKKNEYSRWFSGCSLNAVKLRIDQSALQK